MPKNILISILLFLVLLFQVGHYFLLDTNSDEFSIKLSLCLVVVSSVIFLCFKENNSLAKGQLLRISFFFILGYCIVHFQMYVDYILGNYYKFKNAYFTFESSINKTIVASSIGLICFYLGYIFRLTYNFKKLKLYYLNNKIVLKKEILSNFCWGIFLLFILFADFQYFLGGYGSVELSSLAVYLQTFLTYFIFAYFISLSYLIKARQTKLTFAQFLKNIGLKINILIIIYLSLVMLSGDRGPIIQVGLLYLSAYLFSSNYKIKFRYYVIGVFVGATLISSLGLIRSIGSEDSFIDKYRRAQEIKENFEASESLSPNTHELAISVRTAQAAVDYTDQNGYKLGLVQINQLIAIIPGMGTIIRSLSGLEGKDLISADILTHHILGNDPSHGLGTSCFADIFLDFGLMGTIILFFMFGMFVRYLELSCFSQFIPALFIWVLAIVFLTKSIYIGRSSIMIIFRECIMIYFIIRLFFSNYQLNRY